MKNYLIVAALSLLIPSTALAESWMCPHSIDSHDKKPVAFTRIDFWWKGSRLQQGVKHLMLDHTERDRYLQYQNTTMAYKGKYGPGFDVRWWGQLRSNPDVSIMGQFTIVDPGVATYTETWFDRGKYTNHVTIVCSENLHQQSPAPRNENGEGILEGIE